MSRFDTMFARTAEAGETALGAFLMLGDPHAEGTLAAVDAVLAGGADFLELGIPFSDPVADGPVIQAAAIRARAAGVTTADCIAIIQRIREAHPQVPIGILTYANIAVARGFQRFVRDLRAVGVDALLVADISSLEAGPYAAAAREAGLDWVMIAANTTPEPALRRIAEAASGFTYVVARPGVTGTETKEFDHAEVIATLSRCGAPAPVFGFGISSPAAVTAARAEGAAGVICGSAIVDLLHRTGPAAVTPFVAALKAACRSG